MALIVSSNIQAKTNFASDTKWQKRIDSAQPQVLMVIPWQEKVPSEKNLQTTSTDQAEQLEARSVTQTYVVKQWQQNSSK
ncbi:MAG: hypothetical protein V4629_08925 [Pseudomonadota bacterium]